ncbi:ATP-binding protein [Klebsiella sp. Ap-873]|nr:ATP-binding protein [Klebsiella sp. Ap-873]
MNAANIRQLVVDALKGKTDAGEAVFSPRDIPTTRDMYPILLVQTPFDQKHSQGRNAPSFTTITTVRISGRVQEHDGEDDDNGAMFAELALEALREQVEKAVINSYALTRAVQQFREIRSTIDVNAQGEAHLGQLLYEIDIEYYQGPEDFYPIDATPLEGMNVRINMPDGTSLPGANINLQE